MSEAALAIPGPYAAEKNEDGEWAVSGGVDGGLGTQWVADVYRPTYDHDEDGAIARATARLLSAAPELLGALEGLISAWDNSSKATLEPKLWDAFRVAREATAKARGES